MKTPKPIRSKTIVDAKSNDWIPASFEDFLAERDALTAAIVESKALPLFRGQRRREWRLDSTFARSVKSQLFGISPEYGYSKRLASSGDLNAVLSSLLLLKFGTLLEPSAELLKVEADHGVDSWFELMKRHQQYPAEDIKILSGTNFLDWSQSSDVALYFANDARDSEGALFICDATATGKTRQLLPVVEILGKIREQLSRGQALGAPLLFSPPVQIVSQRAKNQQVVYFAQMDMRIDLRELWRLSEAEAGQDAILVKLVLPRHSQDEVTAYLASKHVDRTFIYPDA